MNAELRELLSRACDRGLSPEEDLRLQALLKDDPQAVADYVLWQELDACLTRSLRAEPQLSAPAILGGFGASLASGVKPAGEEGQGMPMPAATVRPAIGRSILWSSLAVGVLFAAYFVAISWNILGHSEFKTRAVASGFGESSDRTASHAASAKGAIAPAAAGEFQKIDSGAVTLQLNQGATLHVEGPAEWRISGDNEAMLKYGRIVAHVPAHAAGFSLAIPKARIVDLGTEFAVRVARDGAAEVYVLDGQVDVQAARFTVQESGTVSHAGRLQAGQSARVTAEGSLVKNDATLPNDFRALVETSKASRSKSRRSSVGTRLVDLSRGAVASQSSNLSDSLYAASAAIDGKLTTFSHTDRVLTPAWWQVDLGRERSIAAVVLENRRDCCQARLRNVAIQILDDDGMTVAESPVLNPNNKDWGGTQDMSAGPMQLSFDAMRARGEPVVGRFVKVVRRIDETEMAYKADPWSVLVLAEVQVYEAADDQPHMPAVK